MEACNETILLKKKNNGSVSWNNFNWKKNNGACNEIILIDKKQRIV